MKEKLIAFVLAIVLLVTALAGCSAEPELPSGKATRIDFVDGWSIGQSHFEYINDSTVKIIREKDGQVWYVPTSSIDMIWLED